MEEVNVNVNLNIKVSPSDEVPAWALVILRSIAESERVQNIILSKLGHINKEVMMTDRKIDEVISDLQDESTQVGGLTVLTASIKQKLDDALSGVTLPPDVQAKINQAFDLVESNKAAIVSAINANTPAAAVDPTAPGPVAQPNPDGTASQG